MMDRNTVLALLVAATIAFASVAIVEAYRVNADLTSESEGSCIQTGIHGSLVVRVISDNSGRPIEGAKVTAIILNYCSTSEFPANVAETNSSGYANVVVGWVGNFTIIVEYSGANYYFLAWTGNSVDLATLSVPSGVWNETVIQCLPPSGCWLG